MNLRLFAAFRHGLFYFTQATRTLAFSSALVATVTGCVTDQRGRGDAPRSLITDSAIRSDKELDQGLTKIAVLLPITGPQSNIGQQLWDAAVLSLFDSGRTDIALVPHDTQGTALGAAKAAERAVADGSSAVIGPLFSTAVAGARPVLTSAGLRGIALSNNRMEAGAPFFLIGNHPETQVDALVDYLNSVGRRRVKLFGPDTRYLQLLRERLTLLDKAGKIEIVESRLYQTSASYTEIAKEVRAITLYDQRAKALKDFTALFADAWEKFEDPEEALQNALEKLAMRLEQTRLHFTSLTPDPLPAPSPERKSWAVTEIEYGEALSELLQTYHRHLTVKDVPADAMKAAITEFERRETLGKVNFDAVLLPIGDKPLLVIAPMFEYFNATQPDVWLLGTDIWETTARLKTKDLRGSRYVTAAAPAWQEFEARFEEAYGLKPDPVAATAYDAVKVAVEEKNSTGRISFDTGFLVRPEGFDGVSGFFRFLPGGDNRRALRIVEMREDQSALVFTWLPDQQTSQQQPALTGDEGKILPSQPKEPTKHPTAPFSSLVPSNNSRS